jgi:hypothetical protein
MAAPNNLVDLCGRKLSNKTGGLTNDVSKMKNQNPVLASDRFLHILEQKN